MALWWSHKHTFSFIGGKQTSNTYLQTKTLERQILQTSSKTAQIMKSIHLWSALIRLVGLRSTGPPGKDRSPCLIDLRYSRVTCAWPETNWKIKSCLFEKHFSLKEILIIWKKKNTHTPRKEIKWNNHCCECGCRGTISCKLILGSILELLYLQENVLENNLKIMFRTYKTSK